MKQPRRFRTNSDYHTRTHLGGSSNFGDNSRFCPRSRFRDNSHPNTDSIFNMNTLFAIEKPADVLLAGDATRLFGRHNILCAHCADANISVDTYFELLAHACYYKSQAAAPDSIRLEDMSISLISNYRPARLMGWLMDHHYTIIQPYHGIYYVRRPGDFKIQLIIGSELSANNRHWVEALI